MRAGNQRYECLAQRREEGEILTGVREGKLQTGGFGAEPSRPGRISLGFKRGTAQLRLNEQEEQKQRNVGGSDGAETGSGKGGAGAEAAYEVTDGSISQKTINQ